MNPRCLAVPGRCPVLAIAAATTLAPACAGAATGLDLLAADDAGPEAACSPNLDAPCATDADCAQCARVPTRTGTSEVLISTSVQCVGSLCTKTGCPTLPCPEGTSCQGCVVNLPCRCVP